MESQEEINISLSIIVPFHDREEELNRLVDTLPDRSDIQIILIDDMSSETPHVRRDFAESTLIVLETAVAKRYAGSARNVGLERARGTFVCFCDSDDTVNPGELLSALDRALAGDDDVIYTYPASVFEDGRPGTRTKWYEFLLDAFGRTGDARPLVRFHVPWAKLIRRAFIEEHGLRFEGTRVSNDVMFNARLCVAGPKSTLDSARFYRVLQGNPSLTSDPRVDAILERTDVLRRYNAVLREHGLARYRIPASVHLRRLARAHPRFVTIELAKSFLRGESIFLTPYILRNKIAKEIRRLPAGRIGRSHGSRTPSGKKK